MAQRLARRAGELLARHERHPTWIDYGDGRTQGYTFDAMGNRLTKTNDGTPEAYTYNNANMLLSRGGQADTNDANGNTLTGGGRTNVWDSQNRLAACTFGGTTSSFTYAADGLRHRSVVGANTTDYVLDASMAVRELVNGTVAATYLVGPRGPEYRRDEATGAVRWYCYDGLGSVLGEVAPDGTLTRAQSYDVYGCVRTLAGQATTRHRFVGSLGHPSEDETGLIYMRARYYDAVTGRFQSEDRFPSANRYAYCRSSPTNAVDPSGHLTLPEEGVAVGESVGLDGEGSALFGRFSSWCCQQIGKAIARENVQFVVEFVENGVIEEGMGSGSVTSQGLGQYLIRLGPGGQNLEVLLHEMGEVYWNSMGINGLHSEITGFMMNLFTHPELWM